MLDGGDQSFSLCSHSDSLLEQVAGQAVENALQLRPQTSVVDEDESLDDMRLRTYP